MDMYHLKQVPSEGQIRKYLRRIIFGKNIFCPVCKFWNPKVSSDRYFCPRCRRRFSLLSHTWLSHLRVPLQDFWLILWCWTKQMPVKQTQDLTSLSQKGVRHWFDLFREHLPHDQKILEHIIQLDEAYFGGMTGWALLMAKQKGTRNLAYKILSGNQPNRSDAFDFVASYIKPQSQLNTDFSPIYWGIEKRLPVSHLAEIHKLFEFSNTSEIEGMFGVLRTFIRRMYHHVTPEKFPDLMLEFYWRFSRPEMFSSPQSYLTETLTLVPLG